MQNFECASKTVGKNVDQNFCADLFYNKPYGQQSAREKFTDYIKKIMSTSFGPDLGCHPPGSPGNNVPELIDVKPQVLQDARHKELCKNIKGEVTQIGAKLITAGVLIEWSLSAWRDYALKM